MKLHKLSMLVAGGAGYVLGAKAGRQRYEQLRRGAVRLEHTVEEKAPVVKEKVNAAAAKVRHETTDQSRGPAADDTQLSDATWPADSEAPLPPPGV